MIGSEALAEEIRAIAWHEREDEDGYIRLDSQNDAPGWEYVGSGGYRHCFKGPDGNVYKVPTRYSMKCAQWANEDNYMRYMALSEIIESTASAVRIARCDYFADSNVMVQEYIAGVRPEGAERWSREIMRLGRLAGFLIDCHEGNFFDDGGTPVLIDW